MGDIDLIRAALREADAGRKVALATVVATARSVPRHVGAAMVVYEDGTISGTIGGGEMESRVVAEARSAMIDGSPRRVQYRLVDPADGDPGVCGGDVEVYVEPYLKRPTVFIVGGGHVGRAVAELASWSGFDPVIWDDRTEVLDDIGSRTVSGDIATAVASLELDERAAIVVVTRNVAIDAEIMPVLLACPSSYVGIMGSRRRWDTTRALLESAGTSVAQLDRVHSPIGVEIGAETPQEIAVSIMAEVIAAAHTK